MLHQSRKTLSLRRNQRGAAVGRGRSPAPSGHGARPSSACAWGRCSTSRGTEEWRGLGTPRGGQKSRRCLTWRSGLCFAGGIDGFALGLSCSPQRAGSMGLSSQLAEPTPLPVLCSVPGL